MGTVWRLRQGYWGQNLVEEFDPVSSANITEFLFAVIGEVALFARLHLLEVLWAGLVTFWR